MSHAATPLTMTSATVKISPPRLSERHVAGVLILALCAVLILIIALPLWALLSKSLEDTQGRFVGLANFVSYATTPTLLSSLTNSVLVASVTTGIVLPLAFLYAYALRRSCIPGRGLFYAAAMVPVFAPSLLSGLALIYIFGNQGLLKSWMMGASLYGPVGIIGAEALYSFPHAVLILVTALSLSDGRLREAAEAMGTTRWRIFRTITLPGARYGVISAAFVVFTLVITDFGIPKVIGGQFSVLATDAYRQVVGQQNFPMGAVVGIILLVPAVLAFFVDRAVQRRQSAMLSARAVPYSPRPERRRDLALLAFVGVTALAIVGPYGIAIWGSFVKYWPYNLSLTLNNYDFAAVDPEGWTTYGNSLLLASLTAVIGTTLIFIGAYLIEKLKLFPRLRAFAQFLAMLPMAVPGLVLGLGYVFFFNAGWNPLGVLYGTLTILVINTIAHFYTVGHITALTSLKQIDGEFESVSASLKVPFWSTFRRVTAPICLPAILDIAVYVFVNALTTVSAVIFLYGADTKLASIAIVHMDEAGAIASAAGMASVIMLTAIAVKLAHVGLDRLVFGRLQRWRQR
ncbi:Iron(III) transport system permease protein [Bosea sp. 62]|uniref:putative 2-aminoethylphosphonate ABC transporter permease subunit n=1 Tax=unclassified Bosea (in: a-proteobacteria) TaxID=2653178 RepID=UPI001250F2A5|nr:MULTISPECIES: putative 2-aminoethylphosphonate ABC transporter permease subunit [unclassified Bosea (in: a-proteobacteria)]CAD5249211.1 Iron(III) transport system permease protein [Bosea sp. 46]CAD5250184.1 Iron(III) transport system permease protein [Bosea sp. 21B]CAD5265404.1 Iron(III) transport system permease protein [Bosea sp. 7B]VVT44496.1 Iron(III) transport system permease protein [Bosea sp. EC-HK365B]VXB07854.1 Iron(III) transport system permease protein [Bosea sp. 29B]